MAFELTDADISGFYRLGYVVFRGILPVSLLGDLRREGDKAASIARRLHGPRAQRLQPLARYEAELDLRPFRDYAELPPLREAIARVLSPRHAHGRLDILGVLLSPAEEPWCTAWHRDMTLESSRLPPADFHDLMLDWDSVNQVNCPLYDDACTWFVPGSHLRALDLPSELEASKRGGGMGPTPYASVADLIERERLCAGYATGMPGAVQLRLAAGDFAIYRPIGWHIGNYLPYQKRATLHDGLFTPEYETWWREWIRGGSPAWTKRKAPVAT